MHSDIRPSNRKKRFHLQSETDLGVILMMMMIKVVMLIMMGLTKSNRSAMADEQLFAVLDKPKHMFTTHSDQSQ